jgi:hypothetical protein
LPLQIAALLGLIGAVSFTGRLADALLGPEALASAWVPSGLAGGPVLGATVVALVLAVGLSLAEGLTLTLRTVPCTCTYRPGQLRLRVLWPVYGLTWIALAYVTPNVALWALGDAWRSTAVVGFWLTLGLALRTWRLLRTRRLRAFVFEEPDPSIATTIDLSSVRA